MLCYCGHGDEHHTDERRDYYCDVPGCECLKHYVDRKAAQERTYNSYDGAYKQLGPSLDMDENGDPKPPKVVRR